MKIVLVIDQFDDANNGTTARNGVIRLTSGGISTDILVRQGTEKE